MLKRRQTAAPALTKGPSLVKRAINSGVRKCQEMTEENRPGVDRIPYWVSRTGTLPLPEAVRPYIQLRNLWTRGKDGLLVKFMQFDRILERYPVNRAEWESGQEDRFRGRREELQTRLRYLKALDMLLIESVSQHFGGLPVWGFAVDQDWKVHGLDRNRFFNNAYLLIGCDYWAVDWNLYPRLGHVKLHCPELIHDLCAAPEHLVFT